MSENSNEPSQTNPPQVFHYILTGDTLLSPPRFVKAGNDMCPICLESYSNTGGETAVRIPCGHIFGVICLQTWLSGHNTCPLCRAKVEGLFTWVLTQQKLLNFLERHNRHVTSWYRSEQLHPQETVYRPNYIAAADVQWVDGSTSGRAASR